MSDDTPTQRFPSTGGDLPTQRLDTGGDLPTQRLDTGGDLPTQRLDTAEVRQDVPPEKPKSRRLLIGLLVAGSLLLVAFITIIFVLLGGAKSNDGALPGPLPTESASPEPSDSATPEPTPSDTGEPSQDPPATSPEIDSFAVSPSEWACNTSAPNPVPDPQLSFSWSTSYATHVYFAAGSTDDAEQNGMGWNDLPVDGSDGDFPGGMDFTFNCPIASQSYTITVTDDAGNRVSRTVTITNTGDTQ